MRALVLWTCASVLCGSAVFAQVETSQEAFQKQRQPGIIAVQSWLGLVDNGRYDESWDQGSSMLRRTVTKKEWKQILDATRKDLGTVVKRTLVQELPAQNPKNMPKGEYMVVLYQTSFTKKSSAKELLTLSFEQGEWRVITYMIQ